MLTTAEPFAGFGGFRAAAEQNDIETIWSCEIDKYARRGYESFWGEAPTATDITKVVAETMPDFDILTGGWPCQSFSLAGVSKLSSLGRSHGFEDPLRGPLFFELCRILQAKRPRAFVFENVKNLFHHDGGNTFAVIEDALRNLDYYFVSGVVDAVGWLPQHRKRVYLVGFRRDLDIRPGTHFVTGLQRPEDRVRLDEILEVDPDPKYTLTDGMWACLQRHKGNSKAKGNGFGYGLIEPSFEDKVTRTLSHRYYKDGGEILISQEGQNPRRLTPTECLRLQGFPAWRADNMSALSDCRWYMGLGNAVAVPPMAELLRQVKLVLGE